MLQTWTITFCLLAVGTSVCAQQETSARYIEVRTASQAQPAERMAMRYRSARRTTSDADTTQAVAPAAPPKWRLGVTPTANQSLETRQRDDAIELARKRVEFAHQQIAQLETYNYWAPRQAQVPLAVRLLPHSQSYSPVSLEEPVRSFVPRSTFAHVWAAAEHELTDAELQLETLVAKRDASVANNDSGHETETASDSQDPALRLAELDSTARRERFLADSAEMRLQQLSNLSQLTYSGMYENLYRKLELERLEHHLAAETLDDQRRQLENRDSR